MADDAPPSPFLSALSELWSWLRLNPLLFGGLSVFLIGVAFALGYLVTHSSLIKKLAALKDSDRDFAADLAWQMHDNARIQAGLDVDPLAMVQRSYRILDKAAGH